MYSDARDSRTGFSHQVPETSDGAVHRRTQEMPRSPTPEPSVMLPL